MEDKITSLFKNDPTDARNDSVYKAANIIRDKIIMQEYKGGTILTEIKLAGECNTSRSTIRSALKELQSQGLILALPNGRKKVIGFTFKYISDLYDMRRIIECKALEDILKDDKIRVHFLNDALELMDFINNNKDGLKETHTELDFKIHNSIIAGSENYILLQCWNTIAPILITIIKINTSYSDETKHLMQFYDKHNELLKLIVEHDYKSIDVLKEHLDESKNLVINTLRQLHYIK